MANYSAFSIYNQRQKQNIKPLNITYVNRDSIEVWNQQIGRNITTNTNSWLISFDYNDNRRDYIAHIPEELRNDISKIARDLGYYASHFESYIKIELPDKYCVYETE